MAKYLLTYWKENKNTWSQVKQFIELNETASKLQDITLKKARKQKENPGNMHIDSSMPD